MFKKDCDIEIFVGDNPKVSVKNHPGRKEVQLPEVKQNMSDRKAFGSSLLIGNRQLYKDVEVFFSLK